MSATGRSAVRDELDRYDTPAWCTRLLFREVLTDGGTFLEPSAGSGAIVRAAEEVPTMDRGQREWTMLDIEPRAPGVIQADFLTWDVPGRYETIVGNPPYRLAFDFARKCIEIADVTALLLRLNWLASAQRAWWLRLHPPAIYILPNRPSFTGKGTDATDYAWVVWGQHPWRGYQREGVHILSTTPAAERRAK